MRPVPPCGGAPGVCGPDVGGSVVYTGSAPPARTWLAAGSIASCTAALHVPAAALLPPPHAASGINSTNKMSTAALGIGTRRQSPFAQEQHSDEDQRASGEQSPLERFIEHHDADGDGHHRDEIRHHRRAGRAEVGDDPVVEDVGDSGADDAEQRDRQHPSRVQVEPVGCRGGDGEGKRQCARHHELSGGGDGRFETGEVAAHVHEGDGVEEPGDHRGERAQQRRLSEVAGPDARGDGDSDEAQQQPARLHGLEPVLQVQRREDRGEQRRGCVEHGGERTRDPLLAPRQQRERHHVGEHRRHDEPVPDLAVSRQRASLTAQREQKDRGARESPA